VEVQEEEEKLEPLIQVVEAVVLEVRMTPLMVMVVKVDQES